MGGLVVQASSAEFIEETQLMIRNLTTLVALSVLGSLLVASEAQACCKLGCKSRSACASAQACPSPAPCAPVAQKVCKPKVKMCCAPRPCAPTTCAPKVKKCGFHLPKLCFKKRCAPTMAACAAPGCTGSSCPVPSAQSMPSPQG